MKTNSNDPTLSRSVAFQNSLPVSWTVVPDSSAVPQRWSTDARNEELLSALLVLEEPAIEPDDEASHEQWLRLDAKLNMVLSLLSELVVQQNGLPSAMPVNVSLGRLRIGPMIQAPIPEEGAIVLLDLYLSPQLPRSLKLSGRVSVEGQKNVFTVHLEPLSEPTQDLFERYIFRQHRRAIAQARATG